VDSSVLRGQLFLVEDDCRSFTCSEGEGFGYFRDPAEAAAGLWRNAAAAIARGYQSYWMDVTGFPSPRGGYFRDPAIMEVVRAVGATVRRSLEWEHAEVPGIAMVIDDRAALQEDVSADFQNLAVIWQRAWASMSAWWATPATRSCTSTSSIPRTSRNMPRTRWTTTTTSSTTSAA
jgi:hypothetical protein